MWSWVRWIYWLYNWVWNTGNIQVGILRWQKGFKKKKEGKLQFEVIVIFGWRKEREWDLREDIHVGAAAREREFQGCTMHWSGYPWSLGWAGNQDMEGWVRFPPTSAGQRISQMWSSWRKPWCHSARRWKKQLEIKQSLSSGVLDGID